MNKLKQEIPQETKDKFTLVSCSQEIYDIVKKYDNPPMIRGRGNGLTPLQKDFHKIQHDLNALQVKARLMTAGVSREILERVIPQYEKAIHGIIYPLIKENV